MEPLIGNKSYFPSISKINYEGPKSKNPLAYKYYDAQQKIGNKTMEEHLRFAISYWHSFCGTGNDPFGGGPRPLPWNVHPDPITRAKEKMDAAFEFITKLGVPYYCFHDVDVVDEGDSLAEFGKRIETMVNYAKEKQQASGVKLLWGTANLFSHSRYMNGASTNPDFKVVASAGVQVKNMIDATIALGGPTMCSGEEGKAICPCLIPI